MLPLLAAALAVFPPSVAAQPPRDTVRGLDSARDRAATGDSIARPARRPARPAGDSVGARRLEALTVTAVRGAAAPVAQATLDAPALARGYTGQDVPLLLQQAPGVTAWAQSGSQWNYGYFRIRGVDQSRINLTFDGIPLNEPEDQQLYFSNFADLASSVGSVQLQRGVGTSSYGQASFGGSVNFASEALAGSRRGGEVQLGGGSFGAARGTVELRSGQRPDGTAVTARFANQRAEGYRRGSSHAGNSALVTGGWFGGRDLVKVMLLTGQASNGQAYTAVSLDELARDPRANPIDGVGDRFRQSMAAVAWTRTLSPNASVQTTVYGFDAGGWYEYPTWADGTPDPRWELASRWGGVLSAARWTHGAATVDAGVHASSYRRDHTFDDRSADLGAPGYANRGSKTEASAFAKGSWALGRATLFADLQLREAAFRYRPTDGSPVPVARASWRFLNPRAGVSWQAAPALSLFASYGATGREPTRADLLAGADDVAPDDTLDLLPLSRVRPERVRDLELGADWRRGAVAVRGNVYAMRFRDEIALTGATTFLGYDVRRNVGTSDRRGLELEGSWAASGRLTLAGTLTASRNRIARVVDQAAGREFRDVPPVLTPALTSVQQATWRATRAVTLHVDGRWQSRSYLAPTGERRLSAPGFFVADGGATMSLGRHALLVQGRNVLDRRAFPAGDVSSSGVPRFFILAPRNVEATLRLAF